MKRKNMAFYKQPFLLTKIRRKKTCSKSDFYLPEECWEHVFSFITNHNRDFNSLSLVSKQFLSITNRLLFSLRTFHPLHFFRYRIFHRFSNLNSLDLYFYFDADIALALRSIPTLKSLSITRINLMYEKYVTSLFIDSLVSLKSLITLNFYESKFSDDLLYSIAREALPLKRFDIKWCTGYTYGGIYCLLSNCHTIHHLGLGHRDVRCLDFWNFDSSKGFHVNSQLRSLCLHGNASINDESFIFLASTFPNLEMLDIIQCSDISEKSICHVLSRCCKIRHLNFIACQIRILEMNIVVPQLEVLDLSFTDFNDKTLYEISKSCHGLLQLILQYCPYVTEKGMLHVIENCTRLKKIDLRHCNNVEVDVVVSKVLSRSSLKKRKLFSRDDHISFY